MPGGYRYDIEWLKFTISALGGGGGHTHDHGTLGGLGDDDHPHYTKYADNEVITGTWSFNNPVTLGTNAYIQFDEHVGIPSTPSLGNVILYAKQDGLIYSMDDAGVESGLGITDHGALSGLADNDHPQYSLTSHNHDHGALTGLSDDDHPQYPLAGSAETISGAWDFTGTTYNFGDPGTETGVILVNGVNYASQVKINCFGGTVDAELVLHNHATPAAHSGNLGFARSHSATSAHGDVQNGDYLGQLNFVGWHTASYYRGAVIYAAVNGTPGANDMPTQVVVATSTDGSATPATRLVVDSSGIEVTGDVSGTTIGGITEANLVDKTDTEVITGSWAFTDYLELQGATGASFWFYTSGAAADEKWWGFDGTTGGDFTLQLCNDVGSTYRTALSFVRGTGNVLSQILVGNTTDYPTIYNYTANFRIDHTTPRIQFNESDQAADNKLWRFNLNAKIMSFYAVTDNGLTTANYLACTRGSGAVISTVDLGNATDNPTFNFLGTGLVTLGGSMTLGTDGIITFDEHATAAGTPATGKVALYAKADGKMYFKDDAGTETACGGGGSGDVSTDAIWDAKGDLAVGTGANTASKLTVGSNYLTLVSDSAEATGAKWGAIGIPQNAQTGNYGIVLADNGKHIFHASGDGAGDTYTLPANGTLALPVGFTVTFINMDTNAISIAITTDTLYWAGPGSTGTRTLGQYGIATAVKVTSTTWIISGTNLT